MVNRDQLSESQQSDPDVELTEEWTAGKIADNVDGVDDNEDYSEDICRIYLYYFSEIIKYFIFKMAEWKMVI